MAANEPCQGHIYNPLLAASIAKRFFFFPLCSDVLKLAKTNETLHTQKKKPNHQRHQITTANISPESRLLV